MSESTEEGDFQTLAGVPSEEETPNMQNFISSPLRKRLIIDLSSILRAAHLSGKDEEGYVVTNDDGKQVHVNTAVYAADKALEEYLDVLHETGLAPIQTIVVRDGKDSRFLRRNMYSQYKAKRKPWPEEMNKEYNQAEELFCRQILDTGGTVVYQDGMEADDVIAYLAQNLQCEEVNIWSRDGDMLALRNDYLQVRDERVVAPVVKIRHNRDWNPEVYKECPAQFVHVYKALVGDSSDNLPGAKGFGPKAFMKFALEYGQEGLTELKELLDKRLLHEVDVEAVPALKKVVEQAAQVYNSYACAKFYPERVNTLREPLQIKTGYVTEFKQGTHHPGFHKYHQHKTLVTNANLLQCYEQFCADVQKGRFVVLDIETYTPPESDAWVEAVRNSGKTKKREGSVVDVFGSILAGISLTFGDNAQHTMYFSVAHKDTDNIDIEDIKTIVDSIPQEMPIVVYNCSFELPVLYLQEINGVRWGTLAENNGWRGFLPNVIDAQILQSYLDENYIKGGLKRASTVYFDYTQTSYKEVVTDPQTGRLRKMNELTAEEVFNYGCDDTIMTAALFVRELVTVELENTLWNYFKVEQLPQYVGALSYVRGFRVDLNKLQELEDEDRKQALEAQAILDAYLIEHGWPGSEYRPCELTPAWTKWAFSNLTGEAPPTFRVRKWEKVVGVIAKACDEVQARAQCDLSHLDNFIQALATADPTIIDAFMQEHFIPTPESPLGSPKKMQALLYEVMKLPIRLRNKPTDKMRERGEWEGTPTTDAFAIRHALAYDVTEEDDPRLPVLKAIQTLLKIKTREGLFYGSYKAFPHWKDGLIHSSWGQALTVTGRYAPTMPNVNQMPKKGDGVRFRSIVVPYNEGDVIAAPDYSAQELRLTADYSQDENMLSCYIGDHLRSIHDITGHSIARKKGWNPDWTYEQFVEAVKAGDATAKNFRAQGKSTNFATIYGCMPPKLARTLVVSVQDAATFISAKEAAFPGIERWKQDVIHNELYLLGYTTTKLGRRRHLRDKVLSMNKWTRLSAERQGCNAKIQGSGAEMTKLALTRLWQSGVLWEKGVHVYFPVHDQIVFSLPLDGIVETSKVIYETMTAPYADMTVPILIDFSFGPDFKTQIDCGEVYDAESIKQVVAKYQEELLAAERTAQTARGVEGGVEEDWTDDEVDPLGGLREEAEEGLIDDTSYVLVAA